MKTLVLRLHKVDPSSHNYKPSDIEPSNGSETELEEQEDCARTQPYAKRRGQCARTHPAIALPPAKRRKSDPTENETNSPANPVTMIEALMSCSHPPSKTTPPLAPASSEALQVDKTGMQQTNVRLKQLIKHGRHRFQKYRISRVSRETGAVSRPVQRPTISNCKSRYCIACYIRMMDSYFSYCRASYEIKLFYCNMFNVI